MTSGSGDGTAGTPDETTDGDEPPVIPIPLHDPAGETSAPGPSWDSDEDAAEIDEDDAVT